MVEKIIFVENNTNSASIGKDRDWHYLTVALRDFFIAQKGEELKDALLALGWEPANGFSSLELEYEFNRLFTGPAPPAAPPWASVYLEKDPRLMSETTLEIKRLCRALGLSAPNGVPEDWLPLELELWLTLEDYIQEDNNQDLRKLRLWLFNHAQAWLPIFINRILLATKNSGIIYATHQLSKWLATSKERL